MSIAVVFSPTTGSIPFFRLVRARGTPSYCTNKVVTETMLVWSMVLPPLRSVWFRILHQNDTDVDTDDFLLSLPLDVVVGGMHFAL
jgi:hypothetical protein